MAPRVRALCLHRDAPPYSAIVRHTVTPHPPPALPTPTQRPAGCENLTPSSSAAPVTARYRPLPPGIAVYRPVSPWHRHNTTMSFHCPTALVLVVLVLLVPCALVLPSRYSTLGTSLGATALDIGGLNLDGTASKLVAELKSIKGEVTKAELALEVGGLDGAGGAGSCVLPPHVRAGSLLDVKGSA